MSRIHPKVKASVSASAAATIVVAALGFVGIVVPSDVVAAVVTLVVFVAGYLAPGVVTE